MTKNNKPKKKRNNKNRTKNKKRRDSRSQQGKKVFELSYHLVLFVDILGQKEKIRQLKSVPIDDEQKEEVLKVLKDTAGVVIGTREVFKAFFDGALRERQIPRQVPKSLHDEYRVATKAEVNFRQFSDSLIISVPMHNDNEHCIPMNGIYYTLTSACAMLLYSLSAKHPIRGGIDVGVCIDIDTDEIYGAAIERAYTLESRFAEYPRILVGNELHNYLHNVANQEPKSRLGLVARELAKRCIDLIIVDSDGQYILNFLHESVLNLGEAYDNFDEQIIRPAYDFVKKNYTDYMQQENRKLGSRYGRLYEFLKTHLSRLDKLDKMMDKSGPTISVNK